VSFREETLQSDPEKDRSLPMTADTVGSRCANLNLVEALEALRASMLSAAKKPSTPKSSELSCKPGQIEFLRMSKVCPTIPISLWALLLYFRTWLHENGWKKPRTHQVCATGVENTAVKFARLKKHNLEGGVRFKRATAERRLRVLEPLILVGFQLLLPFSPSYYHRKWPC
jgi:hypothetical protein